MIKAVLLDFDGTLVTHDILDVVCGITGHQKDSERINREFFAGKRSGIQPLIDRINFLKGVSLDQIEKKLDEETYLMPGAKELLNFLRKNKIVSVLHSGNILPILAYYQNILQIDYIIGTKPKMDKRTIAGISEEDISGKDFKLRGCQEVLHRLAIRPDDTVAIGDSPADKIIFEYAGKSIAINPKEGIEAYANFVIGNDLQEAIVIINSLSSVEI